MEGSEVTAAKETETLPPGFRFHPTDEELITSYLVNKISDSSFTARAITDVDLNKSEPWDLPGKAKMGEKEWYFFSLRDRKYPTGVRTNRATNTGYWKTTGKDKEIFNSVSSEIVGMKKTLVFYRGRAPRGEKTSWVMHEYRVHAKSAFRASKDEWVVCRVFQKTAGGKKYPSSSSSSSHSRVMMNPYNLDQIGPASSQIMPSDPSYQFPYGSFGRNYMPNFDHHHHHVPEFPRFFRTSTSMPLHQNHINYPNGDHIDHGSAECFTISGLNLNLGGSTSTSTQMRPLLAQQQQQQQQQQQPSLVPPLGGIPSLPPQMQEDAMFMSGRGLGNEEAMGYDEGVSTSHDGLVNERFMAMDPSANLENYWDPY